VAVNEVGPLALSITLDGTSGGSYAADGSALTVSTEAAAGLSVTVAVAGETMAGNVQVADLMPLGTPGEQVYAYRCQGDTLQITPPLATALPFTLTRPGP
jgi:hypothetical protein